MSHQDPHNTPEEPDIPTMSPYEAHEREAILRWKTPSQGGFLSKASKVINAPFKFAGNAVMDAPLIGPVVQKSTQGAISLLNDGAQALVRKEAIFKEYRGNGHNHIKDTPDIQSLDLQDVDKAIGYLAAKYKGLAAVEGGTTSGGGPAGLIADIPLLVTLNLRAIGEYATYCGFDTSLQQERLYAMNVLGLATEPTDSAKQLALANLTKIASEIAKKKTWKELERHLFVQALKKLAEQIGLRLTKAKLAQVIPVIGIAIGAGYNTYFTHKVCDAAYMLYRERFLAAKYGDTLFD